MNPSRETIYGALFTLVSTASGVITASRHLLHWTDVPSAQQPALFQIQKTEQATQRRGLPVKWHLMAELWLYANSGNFPGTVPSTQINSMVDAIEAALAPDPSTGFQTLGGLCSHCWIEGQVKTDEGVLGPQAVAVLPINILTDH